ncbi:glycoside hydrolase superfamily [Mycena capillaripes]|nr:glycoside hydrolase superfamily [Mycena capillaripes]
MRDRDAAFTYAQPSQGSYTMYSSHPSQFQPQTNSQLYSYPNPQGAYYATHPHTSYGHRPTGAYLASQDNSAAHPPTSAAAGALAVHLYGHYTPSSDASSKKKKKRWIGLGVIAAVIVVMVLPVYFLVVKKHKHQRTTEAAASTTGPVTGGDGSTVVMDGGVTFVYRNSFGGYWLSDPADPFANGARANSWTPALNESWTWGTDRIFGVNLGGWFILEPFISPALFQAYPSAPDEWTLASLMRADGTLQVTMEKHYDEFITEQDIAEIAGAGLNWVRVPIPFWAISTWSDVGTDGTGGAVAEPFLEGVCWKYIVRMLGWARKYGIRVKLDLHSVPGSQNGVLPSLLSFLTLCHEVHRNCHSHMCAGYNHSGKFGQVNFLNGIMGVANAQRALDYIRIIVEFISQPQYRDVVPVFGILNEALLTTIGRNQLSSFYLEAHDMIRSITGYGAGNGPFISIHDGFDPVATWAGFLPGADRVILDTHPYFAFNQQPNDAPIATSTDPALAGGVWPRQACDTWGPSFNTSLFTFGVTIAGEFSVGYNDCGLYLTGVNVSTYLPRDCTLWEDSSNWNETVKAGLLELALAQMDAMRDWFFWTWKIGKAADGVVRSPLWSYQLGLQGGWIPADPRASVGKCASLGVSGPAFDGTFSAWQTGGAGAGTIAPDARSQVGAWPPSSIANVDAAALTLLATYTATASVPTLMYVTPSPSGSVAASRATPTVSVGNGWFDTGDTQAAVTVVAGCTYPNAWSALTSPPPTALCTGA